MSIVNEVLNAILKVSPDAIEIKDLTLFYETDEEFLKTLNLIIENNKLSPININYHFSSKEDECSFWISFNKTYNFTLLTVGIPSNYEGVISVPGVINTRHIDLLDLFKSSIIFSSSEIVLDKNYSVDQLLDIFLQTTSPNRNLFNCVECFVTDMEQSITKFKYLMTWMKLVCSGFNQEQENWFIFLMKGLYDPRLLSLIIYFL